MRRTRRALRAGPALFAIGMFAAAPVAAQKYRLDYAEDCSRATTELVQEFCDGERETRLRERLRQIGLQPATGPQEALYHLTIKITIALSGWLEEEVISGKRVRNLTTTRVDIALRRNEAPLVERSFDLDSRECGTDAEDAPATFVLATLAAAGIRQAEVVRLLADQVFLPLGVCGHQGSEQLFETLRGARGSIVPVLRPLLADRKRRSEAAQLLGAMASHEGTVALRMQVEKLARMKAIASLEAASDLVREFTETLRFVPAEEVEPGTHDEVRALLRILSGPPFSTQKHRFFVEGAFHENLLETLQEILDGPKGTSR